MPINPTTKLDAVNEMMKAIGQPPVNTLSVPGLTDVSIAETTLDAVSKEVQSQGWWFNRDFSQSFTPNGSNEVVLTDDILSVRPAQATSSVAAETRSVVERQRKLYDQINNTFTISGTVRLEVIYGYDFEELPESVRRYVTIRAARKFQTQVLGSSELETFNVEDELEAWQTVQADDATLGPSTLFLDSARRRFANIRQAPIKLQTQGNG